MKRATLLAVSVLASAALVTGCSTTDPEPVYVTVTPDPITVTETPEPEPEVTEVAAPAGPTADLACTHDPEGYAHFASVTPTVHIEQSETPDFTEVWDAEYLDCTTGWEGRDSNEIPARFDIEHEALDVAGYDHDDVSLMYSNCAAVNPEEYPLDVDVPSPDQAQEVQGWLVLCPDHPLADQWLDKVSDPKTQEEKKEDAFNALPDDVVAHLDEVGFDRDPAWLTTLCTTLAPGVRSDMADVLASGPGATHDEAMVYLDYVCQD